MAVEIASAYVSIIPTTKGIQANLEKELSPLSGAAAKAGTDSGRALSSGMTGGLGGFKGAVGDAGDTVNGFKSKATGALGAVGISAGVLGAVGGAAIIGFGVHAVSAFTDSAKAALDLGTATGLSTEEASRWIAVGDDMGVSAEALQSGIGKIAKSLDDTKWADFGIATRDAGGEARDVNDILLDSFDKLGGITDETERARVGNELFGKGYASLSPLIGNTREEMEKYLGSVEKGQVITDAEADKAEKMRLAQDSLSDAIKELGLSFGGLLAKMAPLLNLVAKTVTIFADVTQGAFDMAFGVDRGTSSFEAFFEQVDAHSIKEIGDELLDMVNVAGDKKGFFSQLGDWSSRWDGLKSSVKALAQEHPEAVRKVIQGFEQVQKAAENGDPAAQKLVKDYELTSEHLNTLYDDYVTLSPAISETDRETRRLTATNDAAAVAALELKESTEAAAEAERIHAILLDEAIALSDTYRQAQADAAQAIKDENDALLDQADLLQAQADALDEASDAFRSAADANYALLDATDAYDTHLAELSDAIKAAKGDQAAINALYREGTDLAAGVADGVNRLADEQALAAGVTRTATEKLDTWNHSMLDSANKAGPAQRAEILRYIAQANAIPEERVTEIEALLADGKFAEAEALLTELSATRDAKVQVDADTVAADAKIEEERRRQEAKPLVIQGNIAKWELLNQPTSININGRVNLGGGRYAFAAGGTVNTTGAVLVGEDGPELVRLPIGSQISTAADTRALMAANTSLMVGAQTSPLPTITVINNGREFGVADMNHVLAMARLS